MRLVTILLAALMLPLASFGQDRYGETDEQQLLCKEAISVTEVIRSRRIMTKLTSNGKKLAMFAR